MTNWPVRSKQRKPNPVEAINGSRLHRAKPRQSISPYALPHKFVRRSIHSVVVPRFAVSETPIVTRLRLAMHWRRFPVSSKHSRGFDVPPRPFGSHLSIARCSFAQTTRAKDPSHYDQLRKVAFSRNIGRAKSRNSRSSSDRSVCRCPEPEIATVGPSQPARSPRAA